ITYVYNAEAGTRGDGNDVALVTPTQPLGTVYIDDDWTGFTAGTVISDADPVAGLNQVAVYGVNAFSGIDVGFTFADAIAEVTTGGTIIVNQGNYSSQAVNITKTLTMTLQQGASSFGSLDDTVSNASLNLNGVVLTVGSNNNNTQFDSIIGGTGGVTKT